MGLLSNLGKAVKSIATGTKELLEGGITQIPKNVVTRVADKIAPITGARPFTPEEKTILKTTAVAAGALAAAPVVIAAAPAAIPVVVKATTTVAKAAISSPKAALITAVAAPVVGTAIISNPIGAAKTVGKTVQAQVDLGKAIANPSIESAKEFVLDHPVATAAAATVAAAVVTKTVAPLISGALTRDAIQDQTKALIKEKESSETSPSPLVTAPSEVTPISKQPLLGAAATPVTGQTELIATTTGGSNGTTRRKRRAVKAPEQRISQKVNVIVANRAISRNTNKYLNRELLVQR